MDFISQDKKINSGNNDSKRKSRQTDRQTDNETERQTETDERREMYIFVVCVRLEADGFYMLRPFTLTLLYLAC